MTHKNKLTYPLRYLSNYALGILNAFCMFIAKASVNEERIANALLLQGLEWKPCNSCGWHFFFTTPNTEKDCCCHICTEHCIFYKCLECDRKMIFDSRRKDVKVIDAMFCKYHIDDVPEEVVRDNQMFIDFKRVQSVSSEKVFAGIHENHKEDFKKKLDLLQDQKRKNEISPDFIVNNGEHSSDPIEPLEPQTDAEKKALDEINKLAGHKKDE